MGGTLANAVKCCAVRAAPGRATSTPSLRWLTIDRQDRLADEVNSLALKHGWAAGCVFRWNADQAMVEELQRPPGTAAYSFVNDASLAPAVVLFVEGATAKGSYREHIPDAVSFCYLPEWAIIRR